MLVCCFLSFSNYLQSCFVKLFVSMQKKVICSDWTALYKYMLNYYFSIIFQSISVTLGVCSLHYSERDASRPLHDLRTASTRYGCIHCSRKPDVTSYISQHR